MHELVLLVDLLRVRLRGKSSQTFLVDVDSQGLVARDHHVNSQVELVAVDQQWVRDVL